MRKPSACLANMAGRRHAGSSQEGQARRRHILPCQMLFTAKDQHELRPMWGLYAGLIHPLLYGSWRARARPGC